MKIDPCLKEKARNMVRRRDGPITAQAILKWASRGMQFFNATQDTALLASGGDTLVAGVRKLLP
ncbi:MAG: hypothetical protein JSW13_01745 [Candidatus Aerophobus sp.]|nr:MAG: hypothetical protein JSW13_01745 [Candidatus Aerophobus sp.]